MSFAKARLQRFNDVKDCTPSPAKYNVNVSDKIKLGIIPQAGIQAKKLLSPAGSESGSVQSTPCFQTPTTIPKKRKFLGFSGFKSSKTSDQTEEALRERIVECNNKDVYIKELTDQIEELRENITRLEAENSLLLRRNQESAEKISGLVKEKCEIQKRNCKFHKDVKILRTDLYNIRQINNDFKIKHNLELNKLLKSMDEVQSLHEKEMLNHEEAIKRKYQNEIAVAEDKFNKDLSITKNLLLESEAKAKLLEENFKEISLLTEIQMKEKLQEVEQTWQNKLEESEKEAEAILKECQAISEYNIIQTEIEKNQLKNLLAEKVEQYNEIIDKVKNMEEEKAKLNEELNNLKVEKHAYELSITTFRDTIEVLKKRLINSDRDVEQLKEELGKCEEKILQYEKLILETKDKIAETQVANEELEMQYESTSKIMQNQIRTIQTELLGKVNKLKGEMKELLKDKQLLGEVLEYSHQQQSLISQAEERITQANNFIDILEQQQADMETELKVLSYKLEEEAEEGAEIRKKYIEKSGQFDELSQQYENLLKELKEVKVNCEKGGKKSKFCSGDKENLASPKCSTKNIQSPKPLGSPKFSNRVQSPGPLKDKN